MRINSHNDRPIAGNVKRLHHVAGSIRSRTSAEMRVHKTSQVTKCTVKASLLFLRRELEPNTLHLRLREESVVLGEDREALDALGVVSGMDGLPWLVNVIEDPRYVPDRVGRGEGKDGAPLRVNVPHLAFLPDFIRGQLIEPCEVPTRATEPGRFLVIAIPSHETVCNEFMGARNL